MPTVKPTKAPVRRQTTWRDMVRAAEGPRAFATRNRYVAYEFGAGRSVARKFFDEAGSK